MGKEIGKRKFRIISVGRTWAKGKDLDHNEKTCNIKMNEFFPKEKAQNLIDQVITLNCEVLIYHNQNGFLQVNIFPIGEKMESSEPILNANDENLKIKLEKLQLKFALEENKPKGFIFSYDVLLELVKYKPTSKERILNISGIGNQKYLKYGSAIIEVIEKHLRHERELVEFSIVKEDEDLKKYKFSFDQEIRYLAAKRFYLDLTKRHKLSEDVLSNKLISSLVKEEKSLLDIKKILSEKINAIIKNI